MMLGLGLYFEEKQRFYKRNPGGSCNNIWGFPLSIFKRISLVLENILAWNDLVVSSYSMQDLLTRLYSTTGYYFKVINATNSSFVPTLLFFSSTFFLLLLVETWFGVLQDKKYPSTTPNPVIQC